VRGILEDNDVIGQVRVLTALLLEPSRVELWNHLALSVESFGSLGLLPTDSDVVIWKRCQVEELVLITGNRNQEGPESLGKTLATLNAPTALPVITFADAGRFMLDHAYANKAADRCLELLFDIELYRVTARLCIP
jgi:hypothetical protein